ncbi:DUF6879 family protein [Actinokineospora sp. 24-640]
MNDWSSFPMPPLSRPKRTSLMLDRAPGSAGARLDVHAYQEDYERRFDVSDGHASWKLERGQEFREPGYPSWEAFASGDWAESLRLIEAERPELVELSRESSRRGIDLFRVRVVEQPITLYLHWELRLLKVRAECGELIRVVTGDQVRPFEQATPLPEVLTVGDDTVYEIIYDADGVLTGAVRFSDARTAANYVSFIEELYAGGEELASFFQREVAPLRLPHAG